MLVINLFFNFLLSYYSVAGYIYDAPLLYLYFLKYTGLFYFTGDILMEIILYNRYHYIPHHLITILSILNVNEHGKVYMILLMFFLTESTSFIMNLRYLCKKYLCLSKKLDLTFFAYHNIMRNIMMPYVIYQFYDCKLLYYSGIIIQCMTFYWTYKWWNTICTH